MLDLFSHNKGLFQLAESKQNNIHSNEILVIKLCTEMLPALDNGECNLRHKSLLVFFCDCLCTETNVRLRDHQLRKTRPLTAYHSE